MRARAGDHIVLAGEQVDQPVRSGVVVATGTGDGPPYTVRWDDGRTSSIYPGPGSVLRVDATTEPLAATDGTSDVGTLRQWTVRVTLFEQGDDTTATVALLADSPDALTARGTSRRAGEDAPSSHIGDEVAVARALRRLADRLTADAEADIERSTGEHDVHLRPR
ncbi:dsRBD fold-containing protein [Phycicoccus avicenniae]|uniref:dsRBD fold-containing protein n=1 Tax=Phycicoccus avicenniae TaxID=2828860 RepID=UPI003D2C6B97